MIDQALKFLLDTAFGLLTYALLLRFAMQWLRAPFRNPLGRAVVALTDWLVAPVRRVVRSVGKFDLSTLLLAWLMQLLWAAASHAVQGGRFGPVTLPVLALLAVVELLKAGLWLLIIVVIAQALLSWSARRAAGRRAQRADVPLPRAHPARDPAARRHARPLAADPDRRGAAAADAAGALARARGAAGLPLRTGEEIVASGRSARRERCDRRDLSGG
jgi:uncharacterized protein YggT (Ycf19 family)